MCNFTCEIINSRRENIWVITYFKGGQWVFGGASGFSDSLAPRASGCHSPMSRPVVTTVHNVVPLCLSLNLLTFVCSGGTWRSGWPARARSRQRVQTLVITLDWIREAECDDRVTDSSRHDRNSTRSTTCYFVSETNGNNLAPRPTNSVTLGCVLGAGDNAVSCCFVVNSSK